MAQYRPGPNEISFYAYLSSPKAASNLPKRYTQSQSPSQHLTPSSLQSSLKEELVSAGVSLSPLSPNSQGSQQSSSFLSPPASPRTEDEVPFKPASDDTTSLGKHGCRHSGRDRRVPKTDAEASRRSSGHEQLSSQNLSLLLSKYSSIGGSDKNKDWSVRTPSSSDDDRKQSSLSFAKSDYRRITWAGPGAKRFARALMRKSERTKSFFSEEAIPRETTTNAYAYTAIPYSSYRQGAKKACLSHKLPHSSLEKKRRNRAFRDGSRRKSSFALLDSETSPTPATITLRKASKEHKCGESGLKTKSENIPSTSDRPESHRPESCLLYMGSHGLVCPPHGWSGSGSCKRKSSDDPMSRDNYRRRSSVPRSSGHGDAACSAVTFANVHALIDNPPTCTASRHDAQVSREAKRMTSIVRIDAGGDFEQVLWSFDDSQTSCSGSSHKFSAAGDPEDILAMDLEYPAHKPAKTADPQLLKSEKSENTDYQASSVPDKRFGCSWNNPSPLEATMISVEEETRSPNHSRVHSGGSSPTVRNIPRPKQRNRWGQDGKRASFRSTWEPFPPLLNRKSTSEWRTPPSVDPNDAIAGLVQDMLGSSTEHQMPKPHTVAHELTTGSETAPDEPRSTSVYPDGRVTASLGDRIGSSSHWRGKSSGVTNTQPRSSSIFDFTGVLSRRLSRLSSRVSQNLPSESDESRAEESPRSRSIGMPHFLYRYTSMRRKNSEIQKSAQAPIGPTIPAWRRVSHSADEIDPLHHPQRVIQVAGEDEVDWT